MATGQQVRAKATSGLTLQRASDSSTVPSIVQQVLRSPGQPLDPATRAFMEPRFGHDFSRVRVHSDKSAAESTKAVNALAYTVGRDVVFGTAQYAPGTPAGRHLIAHELAHVVQQRSAPTALLSVLPVTSPGDASEQEASSVAAQLVRGESSTPVIQQTPRIARQAPAAPPPAAPPAAAAATLTQSTITPRTDNGCGGFVWAIKWGLNGATASTNGFVVQQLTFDLQRVNCAGGRNDFAKTYWEAWQVRGGKIFIGTSTSPHGSDTFRVGSTPNHRGINYEEGKAKYIEGYTEPLSWGTVPEAGSLPATTTQPPGWSNTGVIDRYIASTFDCCNGKNESRVDGEG